MDGLSPVYSSDRLIEDESVTFVVDTNVLVEFQSLERINWRLVWPERKVGADRRAGNGCQGDGQT